MMDGRGRRNKGTRGELEVAYILTQAGFPAKRTPNSGGWHIKGDLMGSTVPLPLHFEIKRQEKLHLPLAIEQAKKDAPMGMDWAVVHRRNNEEWKVTLSLDALVHLLQKAHGTTSTTSEQGRFLLDPEGK